MKRTERRLFKLNEELARLRREEELTLGELGMHSHLLDDFQRDAAVTDAPADRADARESAKDVARLRRALEDVQRRIARTEATRTKLLARLENGDAGS
jgi:predicted component of type VI protein secretion system